MTTQQAIIMYSVIEALRNQFRRENRKNKKQNKCKICGYPISKDSEICGECACEDDGV